MATIVTRSGKGSPLTHAEVDSNFTNLNTDKLETAGGSMTGNLSFGDNDKAIFGAGSDLQIYHDGLNSYIDEDGAGSLYVRAYTGVNIQSKLNNSDMITATHAGAVTAYHNGSAKLATTSTGIDVTGTVTADGLTVNASASGNFGAVISSATSFSSDALRLQRNGVAAQGMNITAGGESVVFDSQNTGTGGLHSIFEFKSTDETTTKNVVKFDGKTNDISFYDTSGTSQAFFWDASAESLGIGTSSPSSTLAVETGSIASLSSYAGHIVVGPSSRTSSSGDYSGGILFDQANGVQASGKKGASITGFQDGSDVNSMGITFNVHGTDGSANRFEAMRIDSSGNVGIGTSSPSGKLDILTGTTGNVLIDAEGGSNYHAKVVNDAGDLHLGSRNTSADTYITSQRNTVFKSGSSETERMRIDSSGNVGIGVTPSAWDVLPAIQVSTYGGLSAGGGYTRLSSNAYLSTYPNTWSYIATNTASLYEQVGGQHIWSNAASGTAGNAISFSEAMRIDSSGRVGIGTSSLNQGKLVINGGSDGSSIISGRSDGGNGNNERFKITAFADGGGAGYGGGIGFETRNTVNVFSEAMRIDSSGNLLVGTTDTDPANSNVNGLAIGAANYFSMTRTNGSPMILNRKSSDGDIATFRKDGTTVGSIGTWGGGFFVGSPSATDAYLYFGNSYVAPSTTSGFRDNAIDLGNGSARFDDIYATNSTIQTSDRNEKQDIAELSDAEQRVAVAAKGLLRKFRWKDAVAEKGDEARTHFGIIAQDLQAAFAAEGLDAGDYAMFISNTWTDEETGEERTRMGVRYSELLAFIIAAI